MVEGFRRVGFRVWGLCCRVWSLGLAYWRFRYLGYLLRSSGGRGGGGGGGRGRLDKKTSLLHCVRFTL